MAIRMRFYLPAAGHGASIGEPRLYAWLRAAMDRARQRYRLAELDSRLLSDIGVTARQAHEESDKPFWRRARWE